MAFWKRERRPTELLAQPQVEFMCEQDGYPERKLKTALVDQFASSPSLERAYLARVSYGDPGAVGVALCLRCPEDPVLVDRVSSVFAALFGREQHLDIMFLDARNEARLAAVCKPFYTLDAC